MKSQMNKIKINLEQLMKIKWMFFYNLTLSPTSKKVQIDDLINA